MAKDLLLHLADPDATATLARQIADSLAPGDAVLLRGPIGAGKSHCARAMIRHLTHEEQEVPSPTYTLVQGYETVRGPLWHMDLYRLGEADELVELGLDEMLDDAICLIEWPEKLGALTPGRHLALTLAQDGEGRLARIAGSGGGWDRMFGELAG